MLQCATKFSLRHAQLPPGDKHATTCRNKTRFSNQNTNRAAKHRYRKNNDGTQLERQTSSQTCKKNLHIQSMFNSEYKLAVLTFITKTQILVSNCLVNGTHSLRIEILRMIVVRSKHERANMFNTATENNSLAEIATTNEISNLRSQHEILGSEKRRSIANQSTHLRPHEPHEGGGCCERKNAYSQRVPKKIKKAHVRTLTTRKAEEQKVL